MQAKSIRTFIGAVNFDESRDFYRLLGFDEIVLDPKMSLFRINEHLSFYLQDYYVKDWAENSMVFLEVNDLDQWREKIFSLGLPEKFKGVKLSKIHYNDWGNEFFLHDPAGVLWHFGIFNLK